MIRHDYSDATMSPLVLRFSRLAKLSAGDLETLQTAERDAILVRARRELLTEGKPIAAPQVLTSGWAARVSILPDGRRQFLGFVLPGDLIGYYGHDRPVAPATIAALTDVAVAPAPSTAASPALSQACEVSRALDEAYLLAQILRLGRMNAQERLADLVLELRERLDFAGLVASNGFDAPLTQELIGDALGLTSVHINRTLRQMRLNDDLIWKGGRITIPNASELSAKVGRVAIMVSVKR